MIAILSWVFVGIGGIALITGFIILDRFLFRSDPQNFGKTFRNMVNKFGSLPWGALSQTAKVLRVVALLSTALGFILMGISVFIVKLT